MNKELEQEAEKYAKTAENLDISYQNGLFYGYIAGATKSAEITEQIAIEFNSWYRKNIQHKLDIKLILLSDKELFAEFLKSKQ